MTIGRILQKKNISMYRLSKESGVPQATISDICSGKAVLSRCAAGTVWRIARALDVTVEELLQAEEQRHEETRPDFEIFKSNVCHRLKREGDLAFILHVLENDEVAQLYKKKWYPEAYYMLALVDYLSKEHEVPLCTKYSEVRKEKLPKPLYPAGIRTLSAVTQDDRAKKDAKKNAIPEFMKYNIVEGDIRDVV